MALYPEKTSHDNVSSSLAHSYRRCTIWYFSVEWTACEIVEPRSCESCMFEGGPVLVSDVDLDGVEGAPHARML